MLIDSDGTKLGTVSIHEAKKSASDKGLDLVQVSPIGSNPVICKLMDYGKHIFSKKKNISSSKTKSKKRSLKEIKFRPSTDTGDYNIKLKKIKRGREILNSDLGLELLVRVKDELADIAQVDQEPSLEGRQLLMILAPLKKR